MKPSFIRYYDLKKSQPRIDYHIHTIQTDGRATAEEYITRAISIGMTGIAFTEHVRKTSDWFPEFTSQIRELQKKYSSDLDIFLGIETKILDFKGNLDATPEMQDVAEIIIGSVHSFPFLPNIAMTVERAADTEFKLAMAILSNQKIDVLGHPGGVFERLCNAPFPEEYYSQLIRKANKCNKAIEINSSYAKNPGTLLRTCNKYNPKISLGSDAHSPEELGQVLTLIQQYQSER